MTILVISEDGRDCAFEDILASSEDGGSVMSEAVITKSFCRDKVQALFCILLLIFEASSYIMLFFTKFAHTVNEVFTVMMFVQFSISSLVLCMSVYKISTMTSLFTLDFAYISSYLCAMLTQVFLYCWYGNEVTLKSIKVCNAIYEMNWTTLRVRIMRDLTIIMLRATRPIKMSSGYVVTLTTESFMDILKTSYSAYNLLKDS
ncbi:odorant receptor Or2-like [Pseudomyrmex gracilis]|uniref:odorant receptor Or2-like n=1 Tax=Pseudomyrmex gracilis TaxID=219809 RepID=UPI000995AF77|nr:odorant receptor Or2-like [Pseudomyrmex gracilis]